MIYRTGEEYSFGGIGSGSSFYLEYGSIRPKKLGKVDRESKVVEADLVEALYRYGFEKVVLVNSAKEALLSLRKQ